MNHSRWMPIYNHQSLLNPNFFSLSHFLTTPQLTSRRPTAVPHRLRPLLPKTTWQRREVQLRPPSSQGTTTARRVALVARRRRRDVGDGGARSRRAAGGATWAASPSSYATMVRRWWQQWCITELRRDDDGAARGFKLARWHGEARGLSCPSARHGTANRP
jgi:hypothetical protein